MNILALGGSIHDFSACLLQNGKITYAMEEERLTRRKYAVYDPVSTFRCRAAQYCLEAAGLKADDMDLIISNDVVENDYYMKYSGRVQLMNHHLSHAASAYYPSPYPSAAVLVADGRGSYAPGSRRMRETVTMYKASGTSIVPVHTIFGEETADFMEVANSVTGFYQLVTEAVGFNGMNDAGTFGMAHTGSGTYVEQMAQYYTLSRPQGFSQSLYQVRDMREFLRIELAGCSQEASRLHRVKADLAYAAQYHIEQIMLSLSRLLYEVTGCRQLCLAGGVFTNTSVVHTIAANGPFESVYAAPAAGDAGTALGSAWHAYYTLFEGRREQGEHPFHPALGRRYHDSEIAAALQRFSEHIAAEEPQDLYVTAARRIAEGCVLGWFSGCSEFGGGVMGQRAILADPRSGVAGSKLQERIKKQETARPIGCMTAQRSLQDIFELPKALLTGRVVAPVSERYRSRLPALSKWNEVSIYAVTEQLHPSMHRLLKAFEEISGIALLLHSSYNRTGETAAETPEEAVRWFLESELDYLVINGIMLSRR
ncbi:carbamoyltransferase [Paenibacillus sambharensis]|uniref:Carbamoyltransferase n=1 Tax=Paenibacillus sambharensis TaxID=1803190 RepID=A0A2W1LDW0_9BACL|nr:carbamoyltransferase N-terminal domain-containing protein [Paenibacillus sambharensis]PZD96839.1 carbamoyltransferase [Paenibacillus sambharensis]